VSVRIGLCMVVKDEATQIEACLAPIRDLFDAIAIVDTGSTDGTPAILRRNLGVEPIHVPLDESRCRCLSEPRAHAMQRLGTPWVMLLDADERVSRAVVERMRARDDDPAVAGYFGRWTNHVEGAAPFDDYKLFVFRNGLRTVGLVHDVAQLDLRRQGLSAGWLDDLVVSHYPDASRHAQKAAAYRARLECAIAHEPDFVRYHWFLGYMDYLAGDYGAAQRALARAACADARRFPVESLNAAMVLAEIHARAGGATQAVSLLRDAQRFFGTVSGDFEVAVNTRMGPWLDQARAAAQAGRLESIRAYRFAC